VRKLVDRFDTLEKYLNFEYKIIENSLFELADQILEKKRGGEVIDAIVYPDTCGRPLRKLVEPFMREFWGEVPKQFFMATLKGRLEENYIRAMEIYYYINKEAPNIILVDEYLKTGKTASIVNSSFKKVDEESNLDAFFFLSDIYSRSNIDELDKEGISGRIGSVMSNQFDFHWRKNEFHNEVGVDKYLDRLHSVPIKSLIGKKKSNIGLSECDVQERKISVQSEVNGLRKKLGSYAEKVLEMYLSERTKREE
jgi:hypothetical protein